MIILKNTDDLQKALLQPNLSDQNNLLIKIDKANKQIISDLQTLTSKLPQLQFFNIQIKGEQLNNKFLKSIQDFLSEQSQIEKLTFQFKSSSFTLNACKDFITFVKQKFYPQSKIKLYSIENEVYLKIKENSINFQSDESSQIIPYDLHDQEISIIIQSGQQQFLKMVKRNIEQSQNHQVNIYFQSKLFVQYHNCSQKDQITINILIEDERELLNCQIENQQVFMIDLDEEEYNSFDIESNKIMQQIEQRYNFSFNYISQKQRKVLISLLDEDLIRSNYQYIHNLMQQYGDKAISEILIYNNFQLKFYKDVFQNHLFSSLQENLFIINLIYQKNEQIQISAKIINSKLQEKQIKQQLNITFTLKQNIVKFLKVFLDFKKNNNKQYTKLTLLPIKEDFLKSQDDKYMNGMSFTEQMGDLCQSNSVNKLRIISNEYVSSNKGCSLTFNFPIIGQMKDLEYISLTLNKEEQLLDFLVQNQEYLSKKNISHNISIKIKLLGCGYQQNLMYKSLKESQYNFERITEIYFKPHFFDWIALNQVLYRFKRVVSLHQLFNSQYNDYDPYCGCLYCYNNDQYNRNYSDIQENPGKLIDIAYEIVNTHDKLECSELKKIECTCNNNYFQKIKKKLNTKNKVKFINILNSFGYYYE